MLAFAYIGFASHLLPEALFALSIVGCCLGFLIYNHHPAKCFMGDTGSLALGGAVAAVAIGTHTELLLVVIGGIYVLEALSPRPCKGTDKWHAGFALGPEARASAPAYIRPFQGRGTSRQAGGGLAAPAAFPFHST